MRIERIIYSALIIVVAAFAVLQWRKAALFAVNNEDLRGRIEALEIEADSTGRLLEMRKDDTETIRSQTTELMRLRNEVTQLRGESKALERIRAENEKLEAQVAQLRSNGGGRAERGQSEAVGEVFPRESWSFAGYGSPESALVSAIWAMKEGNPETYLNSLTPQEQERMAQVWLDKGEQEIAEKHRNDVSPISGLRVLERENLSPTEVVMNVLLEGPGRVEKIRMNQVGQEWKFGGFVREQQ